MKSMWCLGISRWEEFLIFTVFYTLFWKEEHALIAFDGTASGA